MRASVRVPALTTSMLTAGVAMSLWNKYQDMICVENCDNPDVSKHIHYEQPVWQTLTMFCFIPLAYMSYRARSHASAEESEGTPLLDRPPARKQSKWSLFLWWIPALCDVTGSTLINIGLLATPVSIFQMTRGALLLFVGIGSVLFLGRRFWLYQWISLISVTSGIGLVGYAGSLMSKAHGQASEGSSVTSYLSQRSYLLSSHATQLVIEEKVMTMHPISPLAAVGLEGAFGAFTVLLLMPVLSLPRIRALSPYFELSKGLHQILSVPAVFWSGIGFAVCVAFFDSSGLSLTKYASATMRCLLDALRTLAIWCVSLALGWERLAWPVSLVQMLGFALLVYGTFLFNGVFKPPPFIPHPSRMVNIPSELSHSARDEEGYSDSSVAGGIDAVVPPGGTTKIGFVVKSTAEQSH
ncbi:hypothetical protein GLOTRDRAFT_45834 [Gloeophyllum trabeum ATCC 11539]|uniref:Integral membrane protein n=1 Tax=Gloeophyllum trabeum (strain ATCC 11539 / FP-39264 / Madison 617) TaxID=670483 RepID=S7RGP5_GLOTA|nr:uncharacterized protein GLOTRDRAFT_45834 [Gloeophyllum trabeum ATCC 11539]EPQ53390.1 hypothetical protein GLOTRDRAFT_45834 [Gloeophyllum trabeum ATCC 11539]